LVVGQSSPLLEESLEELLIVILQVCFETLFQVFGSGLLDLFTWGWEKPAEPTHRGCIQVPLVLAAGMLLGWLSLWLLPHSLLPYSWLRCANLFIGPALSAWIGWRIASWRVACGQRTDPATHAWISGVACIGMVVVRFVGATHV
jgi:hypothetical protein